MFGIGAITWAELRFPDESYLISDKCSTLKAREPVLLKLSKMTMFVKFDLLLETTMKVDLFSLRNVVGIAALAISKFSE